MKWIPAEGAPQEPSFSGHTLVLPSCGAASGDQLVVDLLCFNFGKFVGRLLSDNLDFVASSDPFDEKSDHVSSSIDAYICDFPKFGKSVVLRVAANLPAAKRRILEYAKEISEFAKISNFQNVILIRSISSVFCTDSQIHDWPRTIRCWGPLSEKIGEKELEKYDETQELIMAAVYGELCECLKRNLTIPFSGIFVFIHEGHIMENVALTSKIISGAEELKTPPSWDKLFPRFE